MVLSVTLHAAKLTRHEQVKYGVKHLPVTRELDAILRPGEACDQAGSLAASHAAIEQAVRSKIAPVCAQPAGEAPTTVAPIDKAIASPELAVKVEASATPASKRGRKPKDGKRGKVTKSAKSSPVISNSAVQHAHGHEAAGPSAARPITSAPATIEVETAAPTDQAQDIGVQIDGASTSLTDEEILAVYDGWRYYFRTVTGTELPPYRHPPMPGSEGGPHISPRWLGPSPPRNDTRLSMLITQRQAVEMWRWHAEARLKLSDTDAAQLRQKLAITALAKHLVTVPISEEESLQLLDTHEWFDAAEAAYDATAIGHPSPVPPPAALTPAPRLYHQQLQQHHQQQAHWPQLTLPPLSLPHPPNLAHVLPPNLQSQAQHLSFVELQSPTHQYSAAHLPAAFSLNFGNHDNRIDPGMHTPTEVGPQQQAFESNVEFQFYSLSGAAETRTDPRMVGQQEGTQDAGSTLIGRGQGELVLDFCTAAGTQQRHSVASAASGISPRAMYPSIANSADARRPGAPDEHGAEGPDVTENLQF